MAKIFDCTCAVCGKRFFSYYNNATCGNTHAARLRMMVHHGTMERLTDGNGNVRYVRTGKRAEKRPGARD